MGDALRPDPDALRAILARLEVAEGPDRELDLDIAFATRTGEFNAALYGGCSAESRQWVLRFSEESVEPFECENCGCQQVPVIFTSVPAVTASLDAAVALVGRVLPGWSFLWAWNGQRSIANVFSLDIEVKTTRSSTKKNSLFVNKMGTNILLTNFTIYE